MWSRTVTCCTSASTSDAVKARRYRFKLARQGAVKESMFAIGDYASAPHGATTFAAVAAEWPALKDWEAVTKARRLDMLDRVAFAKIGTLPVR